MSFEVINRELNLLSQQNVHQNLKNKLIVQSIWVIEIVVALEGSTALDIVQFAVEGFLRYAHYLLVAMVDSVLAEFLHNLSTDCTLATRSSTSHTNQKRCLCLSDRTHVTISGRHRERKGLGALTRFDAAIRNGRGHFARTAAVDALPTTRREEGNEQEMQRAQ